MLGPGSRREIWEGHNPSQILPWHPSASLGTLAPRSDGFLALMLYDVSFRLSVRLSVTEVHWRIIANLGFKFRSKFTAHCGSGEG